LHPRHTVRPASAAVLGPVTPKPLRAPGNCLVSYSLAHSQNRPGRRLSRHDSHDRRRNVKYMLMICDDESVILSPAEVHALPQIQEWDAEVDKRGIRRGGARLRPSSDASTVRVRNGE